MFFRKKKPEPSTKQYPPAFNDDPPCLHVTTDYADNKIFSRELHIALSDRD